MSTCIHIDIFSSAEHLRGKSRTYEQVKEAVLEAGRFSVFEATDDAKSAAIFDRLCRDPEIETWPIGFPWTGVKRREIVAEIEGKETGGSG